MNCLASVIVWATSGRWKVSESSRNIALTGACTSSGVVEARCS